MTFREVLERKGCRLAQLDKAAEEFTPTETTLNHRHAWEFDGVTSQSLDRLVDRFLEKRPHFRAPTAPSLGVGVRFRFNGGETVFEVVKVNDGGLVIYVEPGDPQRYCCDVDATAIKIL